jgi:hypothetical protein
MVKAIMRVKVKASCIPCSVLLKRRGEERWRMFSAASGEACSLRRGRDGVSGGDVSMFSAASGEACSLRRGRDGVGGGDVSMFSGRGKW